MLFTFQAPLQGLQQLHKHSYSFQLATSPSLHLICFMNFSIFYQEDFVKAPHSHIKAWKWHLKEPLATSK